MAFIRKRISPSRRQTPSHQLVETYRQNGRVRQRVLANLGRFETVAEALADARLKLAKAEEFVTICWLGRCRAGRKLGEREGQRCQDRLRRAQAAVKRLESVVSEKRSTVPVSDTTGEDKPLTASKSTITSTTIQTTPSS